MRTFNVDEIDTWFKSYVFFVSSVSNKRIIILRRTPYFAKKLQVYAFPLLPPFLNGASLF